MTACATASRLDQGCGGQEFTSAAVAAARARKEGRPDAGRPDAGAQGYYGDENVPMYAKSQSFGQTFTRGATASELEVLPKDYNATKRSQLEFYGERAKYLTNSRFTINNADQQINSGKTTDLGIINERRSRKQRANDTNL
jgi:hypothetical protein